MDFDKTTAKQLMRSRRLSPNNKEVMKHRDFIISPHGEVYWVEEYEHDKMADAIKVALGYPPNKSLVDNLAWAKLISSYTRRTPTEIHVKRKLNQQQLDALWDMAVTYKKFGGPPGEAMFDYLNSVVGGGPLRDEFTSQTEKSKISEDHRKLAKALLEGNQPDAALQILGYGMIPIEDSSELRDILIAKLMHIKHQKPYVRAGKPLLKAVDEIAPFLAEAHKNVRKPVFKVTDREGLIKTLKKSPLWVRFDVKGAVAFVTKKEVKENVIGRQDLVLAIVLAKNEAKPYAKIFFGHLDALHGKVLTFGLNFFHSLPEQNEQEGRPFSWKITLEEAGEFSDLIYASFACDMVADHATSDFKGTAEELAKEMLKRVRTEGKTLFDANEMYSKGKRNKDKAYQDFIAASYMTQITFLSKDFDRMHARDKRILEALAQDPTYNIEIEVY